MKRDLIVAALSYRSYALSKRLDDSQIFAVRLSNGTIGYCCVMGNGGEHYSLVLYRGDAGFSTYLQSIDRRRLSPMEAFERQCTFHAINCDFENADDCVTDKKGREYIRKVALEEGIKMCHPKGWPDFFMMDGPEQIVGIHNEQDMLDMTLALKAGCEVARRTEGLSEAEVWKMGLDRDYAPMCGGKKIPLITLLPDGTWSWDSTLTPALQEKDEYMVPEYDEPDIASHIRKMHHIGIIQCRLAHYPLAIGDRQKRRYPLALFAVTRPQGMMPYVPKMVEDQEEAEFDILDNLAESILTTGICPSSIETDDVRTYFLLLDFCEKTGITLTRIAQAPLVNEAWLYMSRINF